jgi:hypothetical protein
MGLDGGRKRCVVADVPAAAHERIVCRGRRVSLARVMPRCSDRLKGASPLTDVNR